MRLDELHALCCVAFLCCAQPFSNGFRRIWSLVRKYVAAFAATAWLQCGYGAMLAKFT